MNAPQPKRSHGNSPSFSLLTRICIWNDLSHILHSTHTRAYRTQTLIDCHTISLPSHYTIYKYNAAAAINKIRLLAINSRLKSFIIGTILIRRQKFTVPQETGCWCIHSGGHKSTLWYGKLTWRKFYRGHQANTNFDQSRIIIIKNNCLA